MFRALIPFTPRSWRGHLRWSGFREQRDGARIAVIGNCQARIVAQSLRVLVPDARVTDVPMGRLGKDHRSLKALAATLSGYDHVFSQAFSGFFPDGGSVELLSALPRARLFPTIVFSAFHPDAIYVGDLSTMARSRLVPSPLHTYHSANALFGFQRALDASQIIAHFRADVFARLGYHDSWPVCAADLLASARAIGFDLDSDLVRWSRSGVFMHNLNHPKPIVLGDIAARLLREAGIAAADLSIEAYLADELGEDVIWPVYPPIAEIYGARGSYLFKPRRKAGEAPTLLTLEALVADSLALYRGQPFETLRSNRTDHWAGQPEICALFEDGRSRRC